MGYNVNNTKPLKIQNEYDFVFIGLGASNSLILLDLIDEGCIIKKKVAVIESENKNLNDKTYCFWSNPEEPIVKELNPIISNYYTNIEVSHGVTQDIKEQPYYYIRSIDLYRHTYNILCELDIDIYRESVLDLICKEEMNTIVTNIRTINSKYIFDSRPPIIKYLRKDDIYLKQSFCGVHIKVHGNQLDQKTFEMMNFEVEQDAYTQFIYTLPFSSSECLVELTRFGKDEMTWEYAKEILYRKIKNKFGEFEIIGLEYGCIPMSTYINPPSNHQGVLLTGTSANLIKPSTGYGFKNMFNFSKKVTEAIKQNRLNNFKNISIKSKNRFRFYDRLLLIILLYWPNQGKSIFTKLFKSQNIVTIFNFLDEKSTLKQEIKIFASLPIIPFLKALGVFISQKSYMRYAVNALCIFIYFIFAYFDKSYADILGYLMIIVGLLWVGIPHGAVDHLLLKVNSKPVFYFILKYVLLITFYFIFWLYFPLIALIIFVIYSSFHFGESELEEAGIKVNSVGAILNAFLIGLSILLFIIFTHIIESNQILSIMVGINILDLIGFDFFIGKYLVPIISFSFLLLSIKKIRNPTFPILLMLLLFSIKLPLLFAFSVYFIGQHSYNAWGHLKSKLSLSSKSLYKKALPYTLGSLLFLALILFPLSIAFPTIQAFNTYFFIFLACISLPHFVLMHLFYKE